MAKYAKDTKHLDKLSRNKPFKMILDVMSQQPPGLLYFKIRERVHALQLKSPGSVGHCRDNAENWRGWLKHLPPRRPCARWRRISSRSGPRSRLPPACFPPATSISVGVGGGASATSKVRGICRGCRVPRSAPARRPRCARGELGSLRRQRDWRQPKQPVVLSRETN